MGAGYDCIVVGARVAGAASALLLARSGLRVLVLDQGSHGSDTLSTHFIWPRGAAQLGELGVLEPLEAAGVPPIRRILFDPGRVELAADLDEACWCPRRTVLDALLVDAAIAAGAAVEYGVRVDALEWNGDRVVGVRTGDRLERARFVVGADGRSSALARLVGSRPLEQHTVQTAGFYAYFSSIPVSGAEFHLRPGQLTYLWPTNEGLTCVYAARRPSEFGALHEAVRTHLAAGAIEDDELRSRIASGSLESRLHRFAGLPPTRSERSGPGWVLIGDAASFKDPTAGMGISEALEDAAALGGAAREGFTDDTISRALADREAGARRIFNLSYQAAELREPEMARLETYRQIAPDEDAVRGFFDVLGGKREARDFFKATTAGRTATS